MTRSNAPIAPTRACGLWLLVGSLLAMPRLYFWHRALMRGETGPTPLFYTGAKGHEVMVVRDAIYSAQAFTPALLTAMTAFALGLLLLLLSASAPLSSSARLRERDDEDRL